MQFLRVERIVSVIIDNIDEAKQGEFIDNPFVEIRTYKEKVMDYFIENSSNPTIQKIKNLEPLTEDDFKNSSVPSVDELSIIKISKSPSAWHRFSTHSFSNSKRLYVTTTAHILLNSIYLPVFPDYMQNLKSGSIKL